jgi:hypothetical protein
MKELMFILLFIAGTIAVIVIFVSIIRWVLRIDEIVGYLKRIAGRLAPDTPDIAEAKAAIKQGQCTFCHKHFPSDKLTITDTNNVACPTCVKLL